MVTKLHTGVEGDKDRTLRGKFSKNLFKKCNKILNRGPISLSKPKLHDPPSSRKRSKIPAPSPWIFNPCASMWGRLVWFMVTSKINFITINPGGLNRSKSDRSKNLLNQFFSAIVQKKF